MANPAAGANLAQALTDHERLKRSTDMPLYFGRKEKDTITTRHLIERIERGAEIATWDAARKCNELYMLLRDKALVWYESMVDDELDLKDWDVVKREFLKTYEPKYSARTTCANFLIWFRNLEKQSMTSMSGSRPPTSASQTASLPQWLWLGSLVQPRIKQSWKE